MKLLDRLQRRFGRYAVPNVTLGLIIVQVGAYLVGYQNPEVLVKIDLIPKLVLAGEVWRLVTFLFRPPLDNPVFAFFFWYLFYLMGTALEDTWGTFRYNVYLLVGYLATVAVSFLTPEAPAYNVFLQGSVFLAFAYLYPHFVIYLFFLLPVKIKWLALITWIGYFLALVFGPTWTARLMVLASVCNFLLFFGRDIALRVRAARWRMKEQARQITQRNKPRHVCTVCGITNLTHPDMDFRYCSKCKGSHGYCSEHIRNHEHVAAEGEPAQD